MHHALLWDRGAEAPLIFYMKKGPAECRTFLLVGTNDWSCG